MFNGSPFKKVALYSIKITQHYSFFQIFCIYFLFFSIFIFNITKKGPLLKISNVFFMITQPNSKIPIETQTENILISENPPQLSQTHPIDIKDIHIDKNWFIVNYLQKPKVDIPLQFITEYPKCVGCPVLSIIREKIEYYYLSNAWVSCDNERIVTQENGIFKILLHQPSFDSPFKIDKCIGTFRHVLFLPYKFQWLYAHWLNEGLSMVISMPKEILDLNPVVITGSDPELVRFSFKVFGLDYLQIFNTKNNFIFAEKLYICKAFEDVHGFGITTFPKIKKAFRKYFELDLIKPTEYAFMNKKQGQKRYFTNMDDVIELARKETNIDWKLYQLDYKNRTSFARAFASFKILVAPCGSLVFNMIYMADETGLVTIGADMIDYPNQRLAYFINIWCITVIHHKMNHNFRPCQAIPENVVKCIKIMIFAVDNQKWPANHKLMESFDLNYIENLYKTTGDKFILFDNIMKDLIELYNSKLDPEDQIPLKR